MFPTRTTSTTGTLRVPPATPVTVRAADPVPAPAPAPAPAVLAAAHPQWAAEPTPVPEPVHAAVAVAAPREATGPEHDVAAETSFGWAAARASRPAPEPVHGWEVPAARSHPYDEGDRGALALDIPHPQDAEAPAGPATLSLRPAEPEAGAAPVPLPVPGTEPEAVAEWAPAPVPLPGPGAEPTAEAAPVPAPLPVPGAELEAVAEWVPGPLPAPVPEAGPTAEAAPEPVAAPLPVPGTELEAVAEWVSGPGSLAVPGAEAVPGAAPEPVAEFEPEPEPEIGPEAGPEFAFVPEPGPKAGPEFGFEPESGDAAPPHSGIPGPGPVEIVAQAVARGLDEAGAAPELPRSGSHRGTSVTEVPVHLPFQSTQQLPAVHVPAPQATAPVARAPRPAPGRRVPRGDDRLREHRGPVLPGWVGVGVGGLALAGCAAVLWRAGVVPAAFVAAFGATPRAYHGLRATHWPPLAFLGIVALVSLGGLGRARAGHAWVLTLFGRYRGTVRRTGLTWVSPLLLRRRVDVRLRHWRSDPMPAVDAGGLALQVVVQVVWQVKDTARATLAVEDHTEYLAEQVESAMARVLSQLPADAFHEDAPTLRDAEAVGDALTRMLAAETEAVGIEVFSAQPTRIEYAAEVAEAMRRRRVAAIDAKHRDTVLTSVVDAVDDTVHRLTSRGLVELDDYERKALVKDLTVAFYTGRSE
ncbi:SPFH domain-containing protein [Streptomyces sp. NC-S4]